MARISAIARRVHLGPGNLLRRPRFQLARWLWRLPPPSKRISNLNAITLGKQSKITVRGKKQWAVAGQRNWGPPGTASLQARPPHAASGGARALLAWHTDAPLQRSLTIGYPQSEVVTVAAPSTV